MTSLLSSIEYFKCWAVGKKRASSTLTVLGVTSYPFIGFEGFSFRSEEPTAATVSPVSLSSLGRSKAR